MFSKFLVANREEIAVRVIRTAQRIGITVSAICSDTDCQVFHVELAEEAVCLGGTSAADSYISIERIIAAALEAGAQAIHHGYGFHLPSPKAIRAMGMKDAGK